MRVVILHDAIRGPARPDEQDTLAQAEHVSGALSALGHDVSGLECSLDLTAAAASLRASTPDVVFNLVESVGGEGRLIHLAPAMLETLRIPFTGSGSEAMFVSTSKTLSKRLLESAGVATPPAYTRDALERLICGASAEAFVPGAYIVKSVWEHASLGLDADSVVRVERAESLLEAIDAREPSLGHEAFAELFIDGREFNIAILEDERGPRVLPIAEMAFVDWPADRPRIVSYDAKWGEGSFEFVNTVRRFDSVEPDLARELERVALRSWSALGMRGYARVDVRTDARNRVWTLEVNANPCLSPDAGYVAACARAGGSLASAAETLVGAAVRSSRALPH